MKLFPKIILILGFFLLLFSFLVPKNYGYCHSDLVVEDLVCLPTWIYQLSEASFYVAIICIIAAFLLWGRDDFLRERNDSAPSIFRR